MSALEDLSREELIALILELYKQVPILKQRIEDLVAENAALRARLGGGGSAAKPPVPDFVKPNRATRRKQEHKKREQAFVRRREVATQEIVHTADCCPDCGLPLIAEGTEKRRRQVIDILSLPVTVTDHVIIARWCGRCQRKVVPKVDLSAQVVGQHRIGINLMALIADLIINYRVPIRAVQQLLKGLYKLTVSAGEITEILHTVASLAKDQYCNLRDAIRGSPVVHGDETSWREDGKNGWLWSFSSTDTRLFVHSNSRGSKVVQETLGEDFSGILVCDFYGAYNCLFTERQRCWAHFKRDLDKLVELWPHLPQVHAWVHKVLDIYRSSRQFVSSKPTLRSRMRAQFEKRLMRLATPYLKRPDLPQHTLAKRIDKFQDELFVFVQYPEVDSTNNAAERAIRPAVIARKISGGTRSAKGSETRTILASLFGTWKLRGLNPLEECARILRNAASANPTVPAQ